MASNPYVNKVQKADGSVIIDISDTTAVDSDVASGKYFYTASGEKKVGTGANVFIITVSYNSTTQMWEPDCTFAEIQAAYNAGKTISVMADSLDAVSDGIYDSDESSLIYLVYQYSDSSVETITQYYYVYSSSGLWANDPDSYIIPAGTKNITQNGAGIDVAAYASVDVAVPLPPDGNLLAYGFTDPTLPLVGVAQVGYAEI